MYLNTFHSGITNNYRTLSKWFFIMLNFIKGILEDFLKCCLKSRKTRMKVCIQVMYSAFTRYTGFSLRIEVAGRYYRITGESGHSEKKLTSSFSRLMEFSRKIPCSSRRILRSPMLDEHPGYIDFDIEVTLLIWDPDDPHQTE